MFEAIHGSAPDIAGQGIANPSGLLLASVLMLIHIGQPDVAETIHHAWLCAIEDGVHTADLHHPTSQGSHVGTQAFAQAVIERFGKKPKTFKAVKYDHAFGKDRPVKPLSESRHPDSQASRKTVKAQKHMVGVDVFVHAANVTAEYLAGQLSALTTPALKLQMITNRGVKVWPGGFAETFCTDHWRCRFTASATPTISHADIIQLLQALTVRDIDVIKTENLCTFDGERGYALGQGQ